MNWNIYGNNLDESISFKIAQQQQDITKKNTSSYSLITKKKQIEISNRQQVVM